MFTLNSPHTITYYESATEAAQAGTVPSQMFSTQRQLSKIVADMSAPQLALVWNDFAGTVPFDDLKPTKKFTDRDTGIKRIWGAIQRLAKGSAAEADAEDPSEQPQRASKKQAKKRGTKATATTTKAKRGAQHHREPRGDSKHQIVIALLQQKDGATLEQIMKKTGWQAHSVRGFISTLGSKHGHKITSSRGEAGQRIYAM